MFHCCNQGSDEVFKVLNCEIGFQDLEKVLNLAKMYIKYWKSMEIPNSTGCLFKFCSLVANDSFPNVFCNVFRE